MNINKKLMEVRNSLKSGKDNFNGFGKYNYRNAETMLSAIKPLLYSQGLTLSFSDEIVQVGERYYIKTVCTVYDTEDQEEYATTSFARETDKRSGMDESQITGATMTYAHKYALMGMFAVSDPKMDPDSMSNQPQPQAQQNWSNWNAQQAAADIPMPYGYSN